MHCFGVRCNCYLKTRKCKKKKLEDPIKISSYAKINTIMEGVFFAFEEILGNIKTRWE